MKTVQWRPEPNALTMPPSYSVRHIPRDTIGYDGIAERMARNNPGLTKTQAEANLRTAMQASSAAQARQPPDWEVFFSGSQQMDFLRQIVHLAGACPCGAKAAGETFHAAPAIHALLHAVCFENQNTPIWGIKILP